MKNIKKIVAFLAIGAILLLSVSMTFLAPAASAFSSDIFSTDSGGQSFTDFKPGDDLVLDKKGLSSSLTSSTDATEFILKVVNFALGFLGLIAVIIVIYGGVLYVTAAGEEEKTQTGKKAITYAAIGLLIVLGSFAFVNTIIRGAGGEDDGSGYTVGANTGGSFNAAAAEVSTLAKEIYTSFVFFAEVNEETKMMINDINKTSLSYEHTLVTKSNMLSYLYSVKERLYNIRSNLTKFSEAYGRINGILAYIDTSIDSIQARTKKIKVKIRGNGDIMTCKAVTYDQLDKEKDTVKDQYSNEGNNDSVFGDFGDDVANFFRDDLAGAFCSDSFKNYEAELFFDWSERQEGVRFNLKDETPTNGLPTNPNSLHYMIPSVRDDFNNKLMDALEDLVEIRQQLSGLDPVTNGEIGQLYEDMMTAYGYDTTGSGTRTKILTEIDSWEKIKGPTEINVTGQMLVDALELQMEFAEELSKLQSVIARLRANVTTGNAPLVVTFDVNESIDPAGGSLVGNSIKWRLEGDQTFDGSKSVNTGVSVECYDLELEDGKPSPTFKQCTFSNPGTYVSTVTVDSNDTTKYVSGSSTLIIKVNPPTTKINLLITAGTTDISVMEYYDSGILKIDQDYIQVTSDDAVKNELSFYAGGKLQIIKGTENVKSYKWDFGDGTIEDGNNDGTAKHKYKTKGKYTVELEVVNNLDQVDRKIFTLDIKDTAAYITITPDPLDVSVGDNVTIDGSLSNSSGGSIKSYEWEIKQVSSGDILNLGPNVNKPTFVHVFEEDGKYEIGLKIVSGDPEPASATVEIDVKSQIPVALIKNEMPDPGQPATVHFDGASSFDPDGVYNDLAFEWSITPDGSDNWELEGGATLTTSNPVVKFLKKGEYEVKLKVTDTTGSGNEYGETTQTVIIEDLLDIAWGQFDSTGLLGKGDNNPGEATINFKISSEKGKDYVIDFGDEEEGTGPISGDASVTHNYTATGKYTVEATVYDDEDNGNSIKKSIYIGGGDSPIAKAAVFINGNEVYDLTSIIEVSKKDIITFDASESRNTDGTGRNLKYSWNFGDTNNSSSKAATHSYDEISPVDPGYFTITLKAYDEDEASKEGEDEVYIKVVNKAPTFSAIQAVPASGSSDLITPVNVDVKAHNADDEDGEIIQYRWWYYDVDDPDEQLGVQITKGSTARLVVGTTGKEGKEITYGFGLEITDSENKSTQSEDILQEAQIPKVTVTNGPNELPTAKFNVDTTTVFTGDSVRFTSASKDPDGTILEYIWDVEGDGFHNNEPTDASTLDYKYAIRDMEGYDVRLKVRDDKGGESISDIITIYVDSLAEPPVAAFNYEVVENSAGKKIQFTNNSEVDEDSGAEIISFVWDFDTESDFSTADSNGDGNLENDTDSQAENPARLYTEYGEYTVKLTVTDNQGNTDEVERTMKIPLADPPVAAFTYQVMNGQVVFQNNSTADAESGAIVKEYIWDFDTASQLPTADSDGDGVKDNDIDSDLEAPVKTYSIAGIYKVMLKVIDNSGSEDSVVNVVDTSEVGVSSGTSGDLVATLTTNPIPSSDGTVKLAGVEGSVTFDFSKSEGAISYYIIDKNIYFDTDGNGIKNDDQDFKTTLPGTWKTNFEKAWGNTAAKLTVIDIYQNESSVTQEIKF